VTRLDVFISPNEKGERCGGDQPKMSAAKSLDDNPQTLAEASGSAAFARLTGSAIDDSSNQELPANSDEITVTTGPGTARLRFSLCVLRVLCVR